MIELLVTLKEGLAAEYAAEVIHYIRRHPDVEEVQVDVRVRVIDEPGKLKREKA